MTAAVVGKDASFEVGLPDKPDGEVSCFLYNEDSVPAVACKVEEINRWWSYPFCISFTPTQPGTHRIIVRVKGVDVFCYPSTVRVLPTPETRRPVPILGGSITSIFSLPIGVAVTCDDKLVVAGQTYGGNPITIYNSQGDVVAIFGMQREESLSSEEKIERLESIKLRQSPEYFCGVAVTPDNHVMVCDRESCAVRKFTMDGSAVEVVGLNGYYSPRDVAIDSKGRMYVSYDIGVQVRNPDLSYSSTIGKQCGNKPGQFDNPQGIAVDSQDILYVCDSGNSRVQSFHLTASTSANLGKMS